MARGDGGKTVFKTDDDCLVFLRQLEEACVSCGWEMASGRQLGWVFYLPVGRAASRLRPKNGEDHCGM